MSLRRYLFLLLFIAFVSPLVACTSILVSARASGTGRPMIWKHRDTDAPDNFLERVDADGRIGYVALYNGGDSLFADAWMGMNDAGFAIMNTASYNLAPDTAKYCDREGAVMKKALGQCRSVDDFATLLDSLKRPMGVQANFGVMDAHGNLAYFETNDAGYTKYDLADTECGYIIRTNYSESGDSTGGFGYIRCQNLKDILADEIEDGHFYPWSFTEKASRSFWHSLLGKDFLAEDGRWAVDQDFIPRAISTASIVIEGANDPDEAMDMTMWAVIGYPPCSSVHKVTLTDIPDCLRPLCPGWHAQESLDNMELKKKVFPIMRGSGPKYLDLEFLREITEQKRADSMRIYENK